MTSTVPPFSELIAATTSSAVHLEMRDAYTPADPVFQEWLAGRVNIEEPAYPGWLELVREHVARGVRFRRARIVSEPLAAFTRFEYEITPALNLAAGEQVRWLPRRRASDLCLPGNDFWLFDDRLVRLHHFSGDGEIVEDELSDDASLVKLCAAAFEAVWERGIDHAEYRPA
ncbi:hypothetical protein E1264_33345 [Actinomadura sp. KC216]|uniref:DUF6879 family protein n=1 Tax=Actinomadura sp. KC216 TaxID=2530370 RepID=UPI0010532DC7|nr:DUF6879 family protein [Actinomadura sp. KC216]TDB80990.1 hypothetical protein E1264_33345 [Actinomadura sp. KC216]